MDVNEDEFWAALRRSVERAEAREREELAEAERLLTEYGDADAPLAEEQVETIVQAAMARDAADEATAAAGGAAAPVLRFVGLRRWLTAAAALLVAPKFLAAAAVVAAVAATTVVIRYSTHSLPFQEAVRILMDEQQSEANRTSADGRVAFDVIGSVEVLRTVTGEPPPMADQARAVLRRLREQLAAPRGFEFRSLPFQLTTLERTVADPDVEPAAREDALERLGELLSYGLSALCEIDRVAGPLDLKQKNAAMLLQLRSLLD